MTDCTCAHAQVSVQTRTIHGHCHVDENIVDIDIFVDVDVDVDVVTMNKIIQYFLYDICAVDLTYIPTSHCAKTYQLRWISFLNK